MLDTERVNQSQDGKKLWLTEQRKLLREKTKSWWYSCNETRASVAKSFFDFHLSLTVRVNCVFDFLLAYFFFAQERNCFELSNQSRKRTPRRFRSQGYLWLRTAISEKGNLFECHKLSTSTAPFPVPYQCMSMLILLSLAEQRDC